MTTEVILCREAGGEVVQGAFTPTVNQKINIISGESRGCDTDFTCPLVRLVSSVDCHVKFGDEVVSGEASKSDLYLPKDKPEYFHRGSHVRVASLTQGAPGVSGELFITEMS